MKPIVAASAALLLIAGCATPLAQTPPAGMPGQALGPGFSVGNSWRYAVHDGFTKLPRGTIDYRVTAVQGDAVTVDVRSGAMESTEIYTRGGNWLSRPATNMQLFNYSPPYPAYAFPLTVGKTWTARVMATDPADGRSFPARVEGSVLGWERVRVPAGEFDTLKVRRVVYLDYFQANVRGRSVIQEHDWYAPALNLPAKRETTSRYLSYIYSADLPGLVRVRGGGRDGSSSPAMVQDDWLIYELVSHSPR